jgi:hypothetical protein
MAEGDSAETDQRGGRRPYIKPFVRNLDVSVTEGKATEPTVGTTLGLSNFGAS